MNGHPREIRMLVFESRTFGKRTVCRVCTCTRAHTYVNKQTHTCALTHALSQAFTVKIGDFGLTRDVFQGEYYRMTGSAPLPIRSAPPTTLVAALSGGRG